MHEIRFAQRPKYFARSTKFFAVRSKDFARSTRFFAVRSKDLPVIARHYVIPDPYFAIGASFPEETYLTVPLGLTPY